MTGQVMTVCQAAAVCMAAAVFFSLRLTAAALALPGGVPQQPGIATLAQDATASSQAAPCRDRDCPPPPPKRLEPPCRPWAPYSHGRSNIGIREMWELLTHGAPMPGTDYYYYRHFEDREGPTIRWRRCGP